VGSVYLICDSKNDYFKIGVTTGSVENRMKKLQTGNGTELHIVSWYECDYPFKLEKLLHTKYTTKREEGEWFRLDAHDVVHFKETCAELQKTVDALMENPYFNKSLPR
jgi:hypothetical protein